MMRFLARYAAPVILVLFAAAASPAPAAADSVLVFAAASLKNALDDAAAAFEKAGGGDIKISYAASSALARQIESGAPADLFISADLDWMNYVAGKNLIKPETRANLLGNRLVLIAPAASKVALEIKPGFALADALAGGRLAMADPDAVPAGKYGKAALQNLAVWSSVVAQIAPAEDVRAALRFVARGEAPLGIVYATDAAAEPGVRIVAAFPPDSYPPIIYPAAIIATSKNPAAAKFLAYIRSAEARPFFEKQGFTLLSRAIPAPAALADAR
jgi:molybdate transport system substrate-binding protein